MMIFDRDNTCFLVVVNAEEQYAIWPQQKAIPQGWKAVGISGKRKICLAYIEKAWTDVRPLSVRLGMKTSSA